MLTCLACGPRLMIPAQTLQAPQNETALVTFIRASRFGGKDVFNIWDSEEFVGSLQGGQYVQREVAAGEHMFIVHAQNWAYIKGTFDPGKKYYILLNVTIGFTHATAIPVPITKTQSEYGQPQIDQWMAALQPVAPNPEAAPAWTAKRLPQIQKAVAKGQEAGAKFQTLAPEDNWN